MAERMQGDLIWHPIKTAPKDGTKVLLFSPDCEDGPFVGRWMDRGGYPGDGGAWWDQLESNFCIDADPTHWMPIPDPPQGLS